MGEPDSLAQRLIKAAEEVNKSTVKADNGLRLWHWIDTPLYKSIKSNLGLLERSVHTTTYFPYVFIISLSH